MEFDHWGHEHLLLLSNEARLDESGNGVVCYGCHTPIRDSEDDNGNSTFYECDPCEFYIHKRCAEAPLKIIYSKHIKHPLSLCWTQPFVDPSAFVCNVCQRRGDWEWFTYSCLSCDFYVDIICALKDHIDMICDVKEDRSFKHDGHEHSLTLQQRPALFHCNACDTESKDYSYSCYTCHFWIHKKCALLPSTMKFSLHNHDLHLAYSFPEWYTKKYLYKCDICRKKLVHSDGIYYCGPCRYFAHLYCAITTSEPAMESDDEDYKILEKFPINGDRSAYFISEFVKMSLRVANCEEKEEEMLIFPHWSHVDHPPLILWDGPSENSDNIAYDGMRCAACMQPFTSPPFYHCSECRYFIHRHCALLPLELQHEAHLDHPLHLMDTSLLEAKFIACRMCLMLCSGFFYICSFCKIIICIGCISHPPKILHNSHRHPLVRTSQVSDCECYGCDKHYSGFAYQCKTCAYTLECRCATRYPHTLTHDYDEHPLYLTYSPVDNPSEFYCEICEEEMYPKQWMYCCKLCSFYFHLDCLHDKYSVVTFGGTYEDENHPHLLTYIRNGANNSPCLCARCGRDQRNFPVLKCDECDFTICFPCRNK